MNIINFKTSESIDISLVTLPFWSHRSPGLGPALLKSYLSTKGISCKLFDINVYAYNLRGNKYRDKWDLNNGWENEDDKIISYYKGNVSIFDYFISDIEALNPKVVGFTVYYSSQSLTEIFAAEYKARNPDVKIIFGGPNVAHFMGNDVELLKKEYIDAVCIGEGENALVEYMEKIISNNNSSLPIHGVSYKDNNGNIIEAKEINYIKKLDDLPFPDFSDNNLDLYTPGFYLPSYISRGCPNKCIYCTERNFFASLRVRSAERVIDEFEHIQKKYPSIQLIRMFDSISNAKMSMLEKFCDIKINKKIDIAWNLENAVIRKEMRLPIYKKLKKSNCQLIGYGMETSSQDLMKDVGKILAVGVDLESILRDGKRAGVDISVNVMFGLPGETEKHFEELVYFINKNKKYISGVNPAINFCAFYPGSFVYDNPLKYGVDLTMGPDFWSTIDGNNTFPLRMDRFERFLKETKKHKLNNLMETDVLPNKHEMLFDYYVAMKDKDNAIQQFNLIDEKNDAIMCSYESFISNKPIRKATIDEFIDNYDEIDYFSDINKSKKRMIKDMESIRIFKSNSYNNDIHPVKAFIRRIAHRIIGLNIIEERINSAFMLIKVLGSGNSRSTRK